MMRGSKHTSHDLKELYVTVSDRNSSWNQPRGAYYLPMGLIGQSAGAAVADTG